MRTLLRRPCGRRAKGEQKISAWIRDGSIRAKSEEIAPFKFRKEREKDRRKQKTENEGRKHQLHFKGQQGAPDQFHINFTSKDNSDAPDQFHHFNGKDLYSSSQQHEINFNTTISPLQSYPFSSKPPSKKDKQTSATSYRRRKNKNAHTIILGMQRNQTNVHQGGRSQRVSH